MNNENVDESERMFAVGKVILLQSLSSDKPFSIPECVLSRDFNAMVALMTESVQKEIPIKQSKEKKHSTVC